MGWRITYTVGDIELDVENSFGRPEIMINAAINLDDPAVINAIRVTQKALPYLNDWMELEQITAEGLGGRYQNMNDWYEAITLLEKLSKPECPLTPTAEMREYVETAKQKIQEYNERQTKKQQRADRRAEKARGYVYLIQSPTGVYKIGRTVNPDNRMATFTVKLPFEVEFVCVIQTQDMYILENNLHKRFKDKRVNGEWFNLTTEDVEYIKSLAGVNNV